MCLCGATGACVKLNPKMAGVLKIQQFFSRTCIGVSPVFARSLSVTVPKCDDNQSWLSKLIHVRRIEPQKESHSRMLSDREVIYELQTHNVKPECMDEYLNNYERFVKLTNERKDIDAELIGSWVASVGDQDQTLHLWRYMSGYRSLGDANNLIRSDKEYNSLFKDRAKFLRSRHSQYLLSFSFWNVPKPRTGNHIYEVRSYILKPGTMIEWGNNWARAIHYRQNNTEAFCGLFSQIGRLYNVHHFWVYDSLHSRKETRESAWMKPGWDECVAYTVPLIKEMDARILIPTSFSPTL